MNKHKVVLIAALALTLLVSALRLDSVSLAQAPFLKEVTWRYQKTQTIDPGRAWVDLAGFHVRGRVDVGRISGGIQGSARVVYNADFPYKSLDNVPAVPLDGTAYGSMVISLDTAVLRPNYDWSGTWTHVIQNGRVVSGTLDATNPQNTLHMRIDTIYQDFMGFLVHHGFIELMFCDKVKCPTS